jgi:hypothetical protein
MTRAHHLHLSAYIVAYVISERERESNGLTLTSRIGFGTPNLSSIGTSMTLHLIAGVVKAGSHADVSLVTSLN